LDYKRLLWFLIFILIGCAAIAPPPGGPVDKTSPFLISVEPPSGTTGITKGFAVVLDFSERIDEIASLKGIRISPPLNDPLEISLKKNRLLVKIPGELEEDQTYLITLSRDILDERGNRLARTYQLAFSTGYEISRGQIEGTVYPQEGGSCIVYLYQVEGRDLDSLFLQPPDYYTETDDFGYYSFSYLEEGAYQLLSFQGGIPPSIISPSRVPYGVHWVAPVFLEGNQDTTSDVNIKIVREVPPFQVVLAKMETSNRGVIRFTTPVKLSVQDSFFVQLSDSGNGERFVPEHLFQYRNGDHEIYFFTKHMVSERNYLLTLQDIQDSSGQNLDSFSQIITASETDTSGPTIISPEPDEEIELDSGNQPFEIQFSDVVWVNNVEEAVIVQDTSQISIKKVIQWKNATRIQLFPEQGWQPQMTYTVVLLGDSIRSVEGITMKDSTTTFQIEVNPEMGFGGLYGRMEGKNTGNSVIVATSSEKPSLSYFTDVNSEGQFAFKGLPESFWLLSTFQDRDGNNRYSYGHAVPFLPSEPFFIFSDTIEVRANWDVEDVILENP